MKPNFSISIPKPCSENWNSFTPTAIGGFCGSCQKNVIDFTKASDDEIIAFISRKPEHVCGRFRRNQLKAYSLLPLAPIKVQPGYTLLKAGAVSLLLLFINKQAPAQTASIKPATEIVQQPSQTSVNQKNPTEIIIKGVITEGDEKLPLGGVSIYQKGTTTGTITDEDGKYELKINSEAAQALVFSFIGMVTQEVTIPHSNNPTMDISLTLEADITGEIFFLGEMTTDDLYHEQESGLKKFWTKIKNWF